jgi:hypothetical protein
MAVLRSRGSLKKVAETLTMRCDAKQTEPRFLLLDSRFSTLQTTRLSGYLPEPFVKGKQPVYVEDPSDIEYAFVVSTLAVQALRINAQDCRFTPRSFFDALGGQRQLRDGDIVLTMDGGTSIGKVAVFKRADFAEAVDMAEEDVFVTVDSHVAILRPHGIAPLALAYLLASPIGQLQFQRAESGASGQTSVTEDDVRYFRFPLFEPTELEHAVAALKVSLDGVQKLIVTAETNKRLAWNNFEDNLVGTD